MSDARVVAPLDGQLDLLVQLARADPRPAGARRACRRSQIVVGEGGGRHGAAIEFEPFDALVGPVRIAAEGRRRAT